MHSVNTQQSLPHGLAVLVVTYLVVTLGKVTKAASSRARRRTQICGTLALDSLLSFSLLLSSSSWMSSAALDAMGAPCDHVVSAFLGHISSVKHMDALPGSCHGFCRLWI